jgi:hypothetical protein
MGLMDRLKETAQELATETKKATVQAQGKLSEVALRRRMDDAAKQLGYLVYRERAKGTPASSDADTLVSQMRALDDEIAAQQEAGAPTGGTPEATSPPIEKTKEGAAPPQSPPEGRPTDQASGTEM